MHTLMRSERFVWIGIALLAAGATAASDDYRLDDGVKESGIGVQGAGAHSIAWLNRFVVQAAVGNLLRNALENSDRGVIRLSLSPRAVVTIEDPGHGMSPEEVSAIYARLARGGGDRIGGGIGLELIARLCEHLGWTLDVQSDPSRGTVARLALSSLPSGQEAGA